MPNHKADLRPCTINRSEQAVTTITAATATATIVIDVIYTTGCRPINNC